MFLEEIGYLPNKTGFCQIGTFNNFNFNTICFENMIPIDISEPITQWFPLLKDIVIMYIVVDFKKEKDIVQVMDLVKLCRNNNCFIIMMTPKESNEKKEELQYIKNSVDVFILLEDKYIEEGEIYEPTEYAFYLCSEIFSEMVDEEYEVWYEGPFYNFSKSGTANIVTFSIKKSEYEDGTYTVPEDLREKIKNKRLIGLSIKSWCDKRQWPSEVIATGIKKASGKTLYETKVVRLGSERNRDIWVTALLSDMDNPQNSYSNNKKKHFFKVDKE